MADDSNAEAARRRATLFGIVLLAIFVIVVFSVFHDRSVNAPTGQAMEVVR